jgi:hypothetical protein
MIHHVPGLHSLRSSKPCVAQGQKPNRISGYLCLARWDNSNSGSSNDGESTIKCFSAEWTVPPPPKKDADHELFLFLGMQPAPEKNEPHSIVQPVLQWGNAHAGGGPFWSIATCFVKGQPGALEVEVRTVPTKVKPGAKLLAQITSERTDDCNYRYTCGFKRKPSTMLVIEMSKPMSQCGIALEVADLSG